MYLQIVRCTAYSLCKPVNNQFLCDIFETYPQFPQSFPHFLWKDLHSRNNSYLVTLTVQNNCEKLHFDICIRHQSSEGTDVVNQRTQLKVFPGFACTIFVHC